MEKTYNPEQLEVHWREHWEKLNLYKPSMTGQSYCILLPPPNVTGTLHMGHGFQVTLMDALIRRHRMMGDNTLWQAGTDHAGIATQMVVERQLLQEGKTRIEMGREPFLERLWQWTEKSGNMITSQIERLGASIDWSQARFSMDATLSKATREAFIQLYQEGLIYRGKKLVNWDPQLHTAISDLEVTTETIKGQLWHIRYPLANDATQYLVVATTRPETMFGDTAIAVHPDDDRYQEWIGKYVIIPFTQRKIPIIADEMVDRDFGSGCVKITPAHDFNDHETGKRHGLPLINIFTIDAHLNENAPQAYQGLDRFVARKKIVADLTAENLIEKIEPHTLNVPHGDRSGAVIEPLLTDQWFMSMQSLAKPAIAAVENNDIELIPQHWKKVYLQWLEDIQDWCISRQLWWGHRIPVWYDQHQNPYVGHDENDVRNRHGLAADISLTQDPDVLDTWFSAGLWPFASLGWPEKTINFSTFFPTQVLVTGFDIIFFWVARMVMLSLKFTGKVPFKQVYVTGLIRDREGKKMSKTKGNILDPIDLIDGIDLDTLIKKRCSGLMQPQMAKSIENGTRKEFPTGIKSYGTDALRFTFCALASTGRDINFDMGRVEGYRNFCNKLWNAARFVLMNTENQDIIPQQFEYNLADQWILTRLQDTIQKANEAFENYRFDQLAQLLYEFTWNEYCDWYLELSKCQLNNSQLNHNQLTTTRHTLLLVLETLLRLMHPIMPFITEEIWQKIAPQLQLSNNSIMTSPYPNKDGKYVYTSADQQIERLKTIIIAIRNIRGEIGINPSQSISIFFNKGTKEDKALIDLCQLYILNLTRASKINWLESGTTLSSAATAMSESLEIFIPLDELINKDVELERLKKEIEKLNLEKDKAAKKLQNPDYTEKAPAAIVAKEQEKLKQSMLAIEKLQEHYERIQSLIK